MIFYTARIQPIWKLAGSCYEAYLAVAGAVRDFAQIFQEVCLLLFEKRFALRVDVFSDGLPAVETADVDATHLRSRNIYDN